MNELTVSDALNVILDIAASQRTTLFIVLGVIAFIASLLAFFGFRIFIEIMQRLVEKEVDKATQELHSIVKEARWELLAINDFTEATKIYETDVDRAIEYTESAIKYLRGKVLTQAKSNLAYYYAYKPYPEAKERVLTLAKETLTDSFLYPDRMNNFKINYGYVKMQYADTEEEIKQAIRYLEDLLKRPGLKEKDKVEVKEYLEKAKGKLP